VISLRLNSVQQGRMLDIKTSADYLSRSAGTFTNFSMLFGETFCSWFQRLRQHVLVAQTSKAKLHS